MNDTLDKASSAALTVQETKDGSLTLYSADLKEHYHSKFGAVAESDTVFVENTGVANRLARLQPTRVLEIGFGTGLNFIRTAIHATKHDCHLHYTGIDIQPPPSQLVRQLLSHNNKSHLSLCEFTADCLESLSRDESTHSQFNSKLQLEIIRTEAICHDYPVAVFDAIYLDAFSLKNNPGLWQSQFLRKLHKSLTDTGTLGTYTVSRIFREALEEVGFQWQKLPGPAGKREVLTATKRAPVMKFRE